MAQDPDSSDEADDLVNRLDKVSIPKTPDLPPVPEIKYQRPGTFQSDDGGHNVTVKIGDDRPGINASKPGLGTAPSVGAAMGAGITFATSIIVGFLIGHWVDHKFGFDRGGIPVGTLVMTLAGMAAGFVNLFRLLAIDDRRNKK